MGLTTASLVVRHTKSTYRRVPGGLERVYTLTLYGGAPPRRFWCERDFMLEKVANSGLVQNVRCVGATCLASCPLVNHMTKTKRKDLKKKKYLLRLKIVGTHRFLIKDNSIIEVELVR